MGHYLWHLLRCRLIVGFVLLTLASALGAATQGPPRVLVIGDSLSAAYGLNMEQGWVSLMAARLESEYPSAAVINASISGDTASGGARRLPALLDTHRPTLVIIELGGNDGLRALPIAQMRQNLTSMTEAALRADAEVLLLAAEAPPNLGRRYTALFRGVYSEVAEQDKVETIPFIVDTVFLTPSLMQNDGIHPTAEAQPLLVDVVWPTLITMLRGMTE